MKQSLFEELEALYPQLVEMRRDFHKYPELSFQEKRTPKKIAEFLNGLGIEVRTGVGGNGVVGFLKGGKPGKTIALRADFDALAIQDEKNVPYKSRIPGVMHACGHDIHTAALLGVAKVLSRVKENIRGNVVFIHQHAEEEAPGGAKAMIEDGCLDGVDALYGAHVEVNYPIGEFAFNEGYVHAASDAFDIDIYGKGGHAAQPHLAIDSVLIGSQLIVDFQQIVSRLTDPLKPALVTVGSFTGGEARNVIADSSYLKGTVRTYEETIRDNVEKHLRKICETAAERTGARIDVDYKRGYPGIYNHPAETRIMKQIAETLVGKNNVKIKEIEMGAEDIAYYLQKVPGTFFWVGGGNSEIGAEFPHHHPKFDVDERSMLNIGKAFISVVLQYGSKKMMQSSL